jgi:predicted Holliday junction resolvase-like endonuclease
MEADFLAGLVIGMAIVAGVLTVIFYFLVKYLARRAFENWKEKELNKQVSNALQIQRPIIKGKISEQLFPILYKKFGNLSDFRFLGNPVDYVSFDGLSEAREGIDTKVNVRFIEIKTGNASLSKSEELVKDAVKHGRVSWQEEVLE